MATLVGMHEDGQHPELALDLDLVRFRTDFEDVVGVDECMVQKSVELVILIELGLLL